MRKVLLAIALSLGITGAAFAKDGGDHGQGHGNDDGMRFRAHLVGGIRNLWQAHVHIAAQGPVAPNQPVGPIAFWFVPSSNAAPDSNVSERFDGEMSGGVIMTNAQLTGPLAFDPANAENTGIAGLLKAIGEGRATIVVHTNDLDNSNNQVPGVSGDSPAGEIRGLIQ